MKFHHIVITVTHRAIIVMSGFRGQRFQIFYFGTSPTFTSAILLDDGRQYKCHYILETTSHTTIICMHLLYLWAAISNMFDLTFADIHISAIYKDGASKKHIISYLKNYTT